MTDSMNKQCPYCGEYIDINSDTCEICGELLLNENLNEENIENDEQQNIFKVVLLTTFIVASILIVSLILFIILPKISSQIDVTIYPNNDVKEIKQTNDTKTKIENTSIEEAKSLLKNKNYEESASILQQIIDERNDPIANFYMGEIYKEQGYLKIAISYYKAADNSKSNYYEAKKRLAETYYEYGENEQALIYGDTAYKLNSNDKELIETLIKLYSMESDSNKLLDLYKNLLKIEPKNYKANAFLASYYLENENYKEATKYLKTMLSVEYNTDVAYALAYCYAKVEYYTQAIRVLNELEQNDRSQYYQAERYKENLKLLRENYNYAHGRY